MYTHWYKLDSTAVVTALQSDTSLGLDNTEVQKRQEQYGRNELTQLRGRGPWLILWEQFASVMIVVLLIAAVISLMLNDLKDAIVILAILIFNATLGFFQDYRAEKAMAALQKLAVPTVRVRRNGKMQNIPSPEVVPGDIVTLEAGAVVPADCRIFESSSLQVQEAVLTGESVPVEKISANLDGEDLPIGDRRNMTYMGTLVTYGRGLGIVTATGMTTELGHIAKLIQGVKSDQTPLQARLDQLGRRLAIIALAIVCVIFAQELYRGTEITLVLLTAISMAVAAVPEGLPAVVTIALALGAQRMLKQKALIRKLPAVETLGSVTVICSDKTGTLTQNEMTVTLIDVANHRADISQGEEVLQAGNLLLACGGLCNDAVSAESATDPSEAGMGDPTEVALLLAAARLPFTKAELDQTFPRVSEVPFSSERKLMTTIHKVNKDKGLGSNGIEQLQSYFSAPFAAITKGAVDRVLLLCDTIITGDQPQPLSDDWRIRISEAQNQMASEGIRVLGFAYRPIYNLGPASSIEASMTFIGLAGMIDPPRPEAREAVNVCREAGIRTVMITGDHPLTALSVARNLGITTNDQVMTEQQLDSVAAEELDKIVQNVSVYARVSPEHKLNIVNALQKQGHIVAMTGDGVNDAPALKKADIGVAMGKCGTDVAKEAGDMVLLDDNFATIVNAVKEGRVIYENIKKFVKYLMATNSAEIFVMLVAPLAGMPLPLSPLQILWLNLVTDGPPALALGVEPADGNVMKQSPRNPRESIFAGGLGTHIALVGTLMGAISLGTGYWYWTTGSEAWQTMLFLTLTLCQLSHVLSIRSGSVSLIKGKLLSNKYMVLALIATFLIQVVVIYVPALQEIFKTKSLPLVDFAFSVLGATIVLLAIEFEKWRTRRGAILTQTIHKHAPPERLRC
jgi:Ca2+-transporting ATPase